jgi:O-antigen ligase
VSTPRFFSLTVFGAIGLTLLVASKKQILKVGYRKVLFGAGAFIFWIFCSLLFSGVNFTEGIYGVTRRQTGFLTYAALVTLMLCSVISSDKKFVSRLASVLIWTGLISSLYGVVQWQGVDPFDWVNPYSPIIGFLGNPNFHASFVGITAVAAIAMALDGSLKLKHRLVLYALVLLALFNIYESKSQQGYLVFLVGVTVVGYTFVSKKASVKKFTLLYVALSILAFVAVALDILQKSPWSSILYKESVAYRGDYWRAGLKMTLDDPLLGVGLDGYRDHYRAARDSVAALRPASDAMTDSAHNVFLDISSGGGFPLLIIYLFIIGLTVQAAIKVVRRNAEFNAAFSALLAAWVAYMAQSLISINQIALATWGWVLMGAIIGYEINTREKSEISLIKPLHTTIAVGIGLLIGCGVGLPLIASDSTFRSTMESGDVRKIEASLKQWPQSVTRMTYAAQQIRIGNLPDRSIVIAREAVAFNPMNFEAWKELSLQPNATEQERAEALIIMKKLDPLNSNLK